MGFHASKLVNNGSKTVIVCCDRLLLAHSANFIKLTYFMVVKIFLVSLFCAPSSAAPGGNCPLYPRLVTPLVVATA